MQNESEKRREKKRERKQTEDIELEKYDQSDSKMSESVNFAIISKYPWRYKNSNIRFMNYLLKFSFLNIITIFKFWQSLQNCQILFSMNKFLILLVVIK